MSTSLSNLVDNLSGVYDKECKKCMERRKIRLNGEFVGFKNGRIISAKNVKNHTRR